MMTRMAATANHFGVALRGWRERLAPRDCGLPAGAAGERRLPGLRREELARLAGLSVDYVVRLEQGRARHPSAQVVAALARALRLDPAERDHLFRCAGLAPPTAREVTRQLSPQAHRLVRQLGEVPVAVFAADWTLVGWNRIWSATIGDPGTYGWYGQEGDNLVAGMFRPGGRRGSRPIGGWPVRSWRGDAAEEEELVADLRVTAAAHPDDVRLAALVDRLRAGSPRFARLWAGGTACAHEGDRKTVEHPVVGDLVLDLDVLTAAGAGLRVVTYTAAADSTDAEKLAALRASCRPPANVSARPPSAP
ncbi:helix-turn-helix domain protein [Actinobacteria bacterium OK074]|nr:helix-turn-helix domain protein [Actinobacteria bacterium OK074]